jgi:hypothetical protein
MTLTEQIDAATMNAREAKTDGCRMFHARACIRLRIERGDFNMIAVIDEALIEGLAVALLRTTSHNQFYV